MENPEESIGILILCDYPQSTSVSTRCIFLRTISESFIVKDLNGFFNVSLCNCVEFSSLLLF
jgi:hypothetical protein